MKLRLCNKKNLIKELYHRIKKQLMGPTEFLQQGKLGGMFLGVLFAAQLLYRGVLVYLFNQIPAIIEFMVSILFMIIVGNLTYFGIRLVFGAAKCSRVFFILEWFLLLLVNLVANQAHAVLPAIIMTFLMMLAVDVFGRCIWAFFKTKKYKQVFGYVAGAISLAIIFLFGLFFHIDQFGENRIAMYCKQAPQPKAGDVNGFAKYLENGDKIVEQISYGPDESMDICTESVNLSEIENRDGMIDKIRDYFSDYSFEKTPVAGQIWYPKNGTNCPTLFIVHGAHDASTPSFLGYDYLGEYLASNGYVVVSVDENIINELDAENDMRAVLLLENMKEILARNEEEGSPLYQIINPEKIVIAGHSRGGEMVATAYLFNGLEVYPENGNVSFDYQFNISGVIAIAPTVDQYMPADHAVEISDVDYLLIHGANDQDVSSMMGEKQYHNVLFSEHETDFHHKSSVYIMGANHGQFNSRWGRYDLTPGMNGFLNTAHFLDEADQKKIAKAYIRTFLDTVLNDDDTYSDLLSDNSRYLNDLPRTVYITNYEDSSTKKLISFDNSVDIVSGNEADAKVHCTGVKAWKIRQDAYGSGKEGENYVLEFKWEKDDTPNIQVTLPSIDISHDKLSFRMADMREDLADDVEGVSYTVELTDAKGNTVRVEEPQYIYPSLALQLYKQDAIFGSYEYKHQMQRITLRADRFENGDGFDFSRVCGINIYFDGAKDGKVIIDDLGICDK
ncbi:MAG: hypothetical protein PUD20_08205 [bacterium]|nr:hypothetical protein [bacterium]